MASTWPRQSSGPSDSPSSGPSSSPAARLTELLARCHGDPDLFNAAVLGRKPYWRRQREIARSVCEYWQTFAYTGNMTGKDYLVGGLIPWWLYTRPNSLVIVTGPSQTLLGTVTWKEVRRACDNAVIPLGAKVSLGAKSSPQVCAVNARTGWQALGYSTTSVERASGQHNANLLVIVEEASGVEDDVWHAIDSLGYRALLAILNPIRADGEAVRRIRKAAADRRDGLPKSRSINAIQVPSTDSPHAALAKSPVGLADRTWLEGMARQYGPTSLWYRSHVKAEIPEVSSECLIPEAWLDWAASQARPELPHGHPIHDTRRIGCDLGEGVGRDSSCVLVRDDIGIIECVLGGQIGLPEAAAIVAQLSRKWKVPPTRISYDRVGIGRDFPHHLSAHGLSGCIGYAGEASPLDPSFTNIRSEAAHRLRQRLEPGFAPDPARPFAVRPPFVIPAAAWWPRLRDELRVLTYHLVGRQTQLLKKKDWAAVLGHSPDIADALIQTFSY